MAGEILTGTASWTDPGFVADWYPRTLPASRRLRWYAEHFNLVEVNSTFYRVPEARFVRGWCDQTPEGFVFDVKLFRLLSRHSTKLELLPRELRGKAKVKGEKVDLSPGLEQAVARRFLEGVAPFEECGKLGALLLQLSPSFGPKTNQLGELDSLLEVLEGRNVAVELRNANWVAGEHLAETKRFFSRRRLAFVMVDAPKEAHFMVMPEMDLVTSPRLAYLRAHGRNARAYIRGRSVAERFDYDYSEAELKEIAARAAKAATKAQQVHVIYNNNKSDYAPRAAATFQKIVHEEYPEAVPTELEQKEFAYA